MIAGRIKIPKERRWIITKRIYAIGDKSFAFPINTPRAEAIRMRDELNSAIKSK